MKEIRNVHWLMKHAKKYTIFFITSEASLVVGYVISFLLPRNIKIIIDSIIINKSYDLIPNIVISYIALLAINIVFKFIYQYSWQKLYNGFVVDIKKEAFSAVLHAKANSKLCENTGDVMCRIEYDCDQLIHMITKNVFHFTNSLALCFVITLIIGKHSIYMAIFVVVAAMFPALITSCFKKQNETCSQEHKKTYGFFTGFLLEVFDHIWQIKLLGSGNTIKSKIEKTLQKFIRLGNRMKRIDITVEKIIYALNLSTSIVVYCVSIYLIYSQRMSVGEFVSIVMYIALLHKKLNWVLRIWLDWSSRKISINRVCELLNVDRDTNIGIKIEEIKKIDVKNVSFGYSNETVLKDVSFAIRRGDRIGIVGVSGVGKTTLFGLLLKLYEPQGGQILINDCNYEIISSASLRAHCCVVSQEIMLFDTSIRDNLTLGNHISDEKIWETLKIVDLYDDVKKLPNQLDFIFSRFNDLSSGQKQRLLIARAVLKNADFYFLDEATSAIDVNSEKKLTDELLERHIIKTALVISHRYEAIKNCNKILVLNGGQIEAFERIEDIRNVSKTFNMLFPQQ